MILSSPERIKKYRSMGIWPDRTFEDLFHRTVAHSPDREAIVDPLNRDAVTGGTSQRITWCRLAAAVETLADNLAACGLAKDDIAIVQMANTWELLAVFLACFKRGIVVSPVPAVYREHELDYIIERTSAKAMFTNARIGKFDHSSMGRRLVAAHETLTHLLVLGSAEEIGPDTLDLSSMLADHVAFPDRIAAPKSHVCADDVVTIVWTSGSEGRPKGIPRSHAQWLVSAGTIAEACSMPEGVRLLSARPLVTHGAMSGTILPWLHTGGTVVLHQPFSLELYVRQLRDERIGFTSIAPAILVSMLADPSLLDGVDFKRLHTIGSGSAPLSPSLIEEFEARFGARIVNFFGSTEGVSLASTPADVPDPAQRATLFPRFGVQGFEWAYPTATFLETRLVDPETGEVLTTPGRPGELRVRGPVVFDGYFNDARLTAGAFDQEGFYRSGDLFEIAGDREQFYRYVGRIKDIIVRGGFNISAAEVEILVAAFPGVKEVGVVGVPDPRLGERICAFIAMRPGIPAPSLATLIDFLKNSLHVANLKLPEKLVVVESLPRNANTKVDKAQLRKLISG